MGIREIKKWREKSLPIGIYFVLFFSHTPVWRHSSGVLSPYWPKYLFQNLSLGITDGFIFINWVKKKCAKRTILVTGQVVCALRRTPRLYFHSTPPNKCIEVHFLNIFKFVQPGILLHHQIEFFFLRWKFSFNLKLNLRLQVIMNINRKNTF